MYLRVSAGDGSYKVVSQPFQPIYEGGQKISFLGQIGDGILFCATQINEVRPFKEDAFRMKNAPFEFRLSIASADFRDQDNRIYGFDITGKKKLSDLGTTIRLCNSTKARIALCDDRIPSVFLFPGRHNLIVIQISTDTCKAISGIISFEDFPYYSGFVFHN